MNTTPAANGIIRHILTFVGGILVAKGLLSEELMLEAVGALTTIVGFIWSFLKNKN